MIREVLLPLCLALVDCVSQTAYTASATVDAAGHISEGPAWAALTADVATALPEDGDPVREPRGSPLVRHEAAQRSLVARASGHANASTLDRSLVAKGSNADAAPDQAGWACQTGPVTNPEEAARTYSSVYKNGGPGSYYARSMLDSDLAWLAGVNRVGEWMQIDLGVVQGVRGIVVQGPGHIDPKFHSGVSKFKVTYSLDAISFSDLGVEFEGSTQGDAKGERLFAAPVRARYLRFVVTSWLGQIAMRAGAMLCHSCMPGPERNPVELHRSYSSIHGDTQNRFLAFRSMLDRPGAWQAAEKRAGEWLQIDLGSVQTVRGTVIQGQDVFKNTPQWVTKYTVRYSEDGVLYKDVKEDFSGNTDPRTKVKRLFATPVKARFVRFVVLAWYGHISMRAGVLTCQDCWWGETLNPPEASRTYSSVLGNDAPGSGWARSMMDSKRSWVPRTSARGQFMTIDLGGLHEVRGVVVQGDNLVENWVSKYSVELSDDGKVFNDEGEEFPGLWKLNAEQFRRSVRARYVRFVPLAWQGLISMRAEVLTCKSCVPARMNPSESRRTYSSTLHNDVHSMLGGVMAWIPADPQKPGEWLMIDLGTAQYVRGTVVEAWMVPKWWVTMYDVATSVTGKDFQSQGAFYGPWNEEEVERPFEKMTYARYVRFVVRAWHGARIAMKAGVLTCNTLS